MDRVVTVRSEATGATADVRLSADGTTVGDVLPELRRLTATTTGALARDGQPLHDREPVAHLRDGDLLVLGDSDPRSPATAMAAMEVVSGPDAGRVILLPPGRHVLGRDNAPVFGTDTTLSRQHLEVVVAPDRTVTVTDLHTCNGSRLGDADLVPGAPTCWPSGVVVRAGDTVLRHASSTNTAAAIVQSASGVTFVNRAPRLRADVPPAKVTFPAPPATTQVARVPLLASVAPLVAGVVLALVIRRWEFVAFAVMSPLVVLGQWASDWWRARRADRRAGTDHAEAVADAERRLADALASEEQQRRDTAPDLAALVTAATQRTSLLWHRGLDEDDALTVRVGIGTLTARVEVAGTHRTPVVHAVPVCIDLRVVGMVGICGRRECTTALARSLVVQAATVLGPGALQVHVLSPGRASQWAWSRWLPHQRRSADAFGAPLTTSVEVRTAVEQLRSCPDGRHRLVVVDGVNDPAVAAALGESPQTSVLWLADSETALPAGCAAVVGVDGAPARAVLCTGGSATSDIVPDLLAIDVAESVARALCPLRDARTGSAAIPTNVSWSSLHGLRLGDGPEAAAAALARRWRSGPSMTVCLGIGAGGPCLVDLQRDGPHMLVAGTTGSGKSELLQTLVASLVAGNSPSDLALLLIDYKGGAAFGPCASLPHTVGVLTDLDAASTSRAIDSLSAELRRRERLLAEAGVADLEAWRTRAAADAEPLPKLVIVVDEFATLAEELPDFVGGLVAIAQRGRSLGVHLVLATQRPEGAVSADIRANVRLRVCLAVAREAESRDVIDGPQASHISRTTPGRALVRLSASDLVEMQTARVAGAVSPATEAPVKVVTLGGPDAAAPPIADGPTELDVLAAAATRAAELVGARLVTPPWLPPLPHEVTLTALRSRPVEPGHAPIGLVDLPQDQCQRALTVRPDCADPLLIVGGPRSGRTTAVTTIATALATLLPPDRLHIWAIDSGSSLNPLAELPHTGAVVDVRDSDRLDRLVSFLIEEVARRRSRRSADDPALLLVVDSWDGLTHATADVDAGRCGDLLLRLVGDGAAVGLRVVATSDRGGLSGRVASAFGDRICLRLPDPSDYALIGLTPRQVPGDMPPGRALRSGRAVELVQLAVTDPQTAAAAAAWPPASAPPRRFESLPAHVPLHALVAGRRHGLVVGLRGDDLTPACVDPAEIGGSLLVAGPPRSGRSTALISLAAQLQDRRVIAVCARRGPLHRRRDLAHVVDATDADKMRTALAADPDAVLLIDDVDLLDDTAVLDVIETAVRRARDGHGLVVLAGATDAMTSSFRGPVAQARRSRVGLLLRPEGPHDGELFGLRLRRRPALADPPGRGLLALHGRALPVQIADPG